MFLLDLLRSFSFFCCRERYFSILWPNIFNSRFVYMLFLRGKYGSFSSRASVILPLPSPLPFIPFFLILFPPFIYSLPPPFLPSSPYLLLSVPILCPPLMFSFLLTPFYPFCNFISTSYFLFSYFISSHSFFHCFISAVPLHSFLHFPLFIPSLFHSFPFLSLLFLYNSVSFLLHIFLPHFFHTSFTFPFLFLPLLFHPLSLLFPFVTFLLQIQFLPFRRFPFPLRSLFPLVALAISIYLFSH